MVGRNRKWCRFFFQDHPDFRLRPMPPDSHVNNKVKVWCKKCLMLTIQEEKERDRIDVLAQRLSTPRTDDVIQATGACAWSYSDAALYRHWFASVGYTRWMDAISAFEHDQPLADLYSAAGHSTNLGGVGPQRQDNRWHNIVQSENWFNAEALDANWLTIIAGQAQWAQHVETAHCLYRVPAWGAAADECGSARRSVRCWSINPQVR